MKPIFSILALLILASVSCKKDDVNKSVTAKNIAEIYQVTFMSHQVGTAPPVDGIATANVCERDDLIQMNENLTFNYLDAGIQCTPPRIGSGSRGLPSATVITIAEKITTLYLLMDAPLL